MAKIEKLVYVAPSAQSMRVALSIAREAYKGYKAEIAMSVTTGNVPCIVLIRDEDVPPQCDWLFQEVLGVVRGAYLASQMYEAKIAARSAQERDGG